MRELRAAVVAIALFTAVLGLAYPAVMTLAPGTPAEVGRSFAGCKACFQSRPSATDYSVTPTSFNNQGPNQRVLADQLGGYVRQYLRREGRYTPGLTAARIPSDAVTNSASGVDPHISIENARIQANRVAAVLRRPEADVLAAVERARTGNAVDVAELNEALR